MRLIEMLTLLGVLLIGSLLVARVASLLPPTTDRAAIAQALDRRAIVYRDILIHRSRCVPSAEQCLLYRIEAVIVAERPLAGFLECPQRGQGCRLHAPGLGLVGLPVPDQSPPVSRAWAARAESLVQDVRIWLGVSAR